MTSTNDLLDAPAPSLVSVMLDTRAEMIDTVVGIDKLVSALLAHKAAVVAQLADWPEVTDSVSSSSSSSTPHAWDASTVARRELETELACALRIPERTAQNLLGESRALVALPLTHAALSAGDISYRHAQKMVDHALSIPAVAREAFETELLPYAQRLTVARFDTKARATRERTHPESVTSRKGAAVDKRSLHFEPARDGMGWLTAYLPAEQGLAIYRAITETAVSLQGTEENTDDPRTLTQLRADVFADQLLGGDAGTIRATVFVTVPALTLLDRESGGEPANLDGYGPIDLDTAKRLTANAPSFLRILTHPETGATLSVGRERYKPPADLVAFLRVRDGTCRFPGCGCSADRSEIDHTIPWQNGGPTEAENLAHLCKKHHRLKHNSAWTMKQLGAGIIEWTSPDGRPYITEPAVRIEPHRPA